MSAIVEQPGTAILFVCLGNICRSPLAEGVFRATMAATGRDSGFFIDSAGTGGWHQGSAPDPRSIAVARRHGIDIAGQRARKLAAQDFQRFDLILGMDQSNVEELRSRAPDRHASRVHGFVEYATGKACDVPDPYYGGPDGFDAVYRMILEASEALAARLLARPLSAPARGHASSTT